MFNQDSINQLKENLRGPVVEPEDGDYDEVRKLYNGMIDKRPRVMARCLDVADVMVAVNFARENEVLTAVRGGGHNGAGLASCDEGFMIDLSLMKDLHVDPDSRQVRVGPGHSQGDMDHATHAFGLAVPAGIVSTTGVAGLTLGGGHGYLSRQYGLTIDNLLEADVVLADGSFVKASEKENADLFWALRGGGGNFGIVTSFLFEAQPVSTVVGGPMFYKAEDARAVLEWYREFMPQAPEQLYAVFGLKTVPGAPPFPEAIWGQPIAALIWCYDGSEERAKEAMQAVRDLPKPIFEHVGPMPFPALQSLFDPLLPPGLQWYWKGDFVKEISDEALEIYLQYGLNLPTPKCLMHLYPIDGAVQRVPADAMAWSYRDVTWSMVIAGIDPDPKNADKIRQWARGYWEALRPYTAGAGYVNFMMEEGQERVQATYGENYPRLRELKRKYDPTNLFRVNQNISPK